MWVQHAKKVTLRKGSSVIPPNSAGNAVLAAPPEILAGSLREPSGWGCGGLARNDNFPTLFFPPVRMKSAFLLLFLTAATPKLPLVEVPATRGTSDTLVVFVSGDGGWAAIDREISKVLADDGMPVVGLNALQYFWTKRTPETASRDLDSVIARYLGEWHKSRVILAGYSRGADVLPAMISHLPAETRMKIRAIVLLGPSPKVEFEFHVADWLRDASAGVAVKPEVKKLAPAHILCIYGESDRDSLCPALKSQPGVNVVVLKGAHHFDGGYANLGRLIIEHIQ
jgi:type IV secretory pathway VirJ component